MQADLIHTGQKSHCELLAHDCTKTFHLESATKQLGSESTKD